MGLFGFGKKEAPEIVSTRVLPELSSSQRRASNLPSIPSGNASRDNLNEEMIKSAIGDNSYEDEESESLSFDQRPKMNRIPSPPRQFSYSPMENQPKKETIFVKIDKFQESQESLGEIEDQLKDLSSDIEALRDIKLKEAKELSEWDEELKKINAALSKIDANIFGEV
jgi:peptidoglycan hydrolase CwlO-like protein